jgi:ribonuclease J
VLSARIIPGNERAISKLIGFIYKKGANIIEEKRRLIHVSGHASQEDIRIMTEAVRPKFVVPIHGEYRMLFRHKEFVKNHLDIPEERIILIENGDVLELDGERASVVDKREIRRTFIDDSGFEEIEYETVRELIVTINSVSGQLETAPRIVANGVRGIDGTNGFIKSAQTAVTNAFAKASVVQLADDSLLKEYLRLELKRFIQNQTGSRPVITPVIQKI